MADPPGTADQGETEMRLGDQGEATPPRGATHRAGVRPVGRPVTYVIGLILLVAGGLVLTNVVRQPNVVRAFEPLSDSVRALPEAPAGPMIQRWARRLPRDDELVGLVVVDDLVVVARRARPALRDPGDGLVVTAREAGNGRTRWQTVVEPIGALVAMVSDDTVALLSTDGPLSLANRTSTVSDTGEMEWLVVLDPADGRRRWELELDADFSWVLARPDRASFVVNDPHGVRELDAEDGSVRLEFPHQGGTAGLRRATLHDDTWIVPGPPGAWTLVGADGTVRERITGSPVRPWLTNDLFVTATDGVVTARHRGGSVAWEVEVDHAVDALGGTSGLAGPEKALLTTAGAAPADAVVVVAREGPGSAARPAITGITERGTTIDLTGGTNAAPTRWYAIGDDVLGLCVHQPDFTQTERRTCSHEVSLRTLDGDLVAGRDDVDLFLTVPRVALGTQVGVVVVEQGGLTLLRWSDLATAWTIDNGRRGPIPAALAPTARGVAVGWDAPLPPTIAWYS